MPHAALRPAPPDGAAARTGPSRGRPRAPDGPDKPPPRRNRCGCRWRSATAPRAAARAAAARPGTRSSRPPSSSTLTEPMESRHTDSASRVMDSSTAGSGALIVSCWKTSRSAAAMLSACRRWAGSGRPRSFSQRHRPARPPSSATTPRCRCPRSAGWKTCGTPIRCPSPSAPPPAH